MCINKDLFYGKAERRVFLSAPPRLGPGEIAKAVMSYCEPVTKMETTEVSSIDDWMK